MGFPEVLEYPSTWGRFEVLHCMPEGYARFCEKSKGTVPLEGLQSNQMLRVRPATEGRLEPVTGLEPWSYSIEPGRGICTHEKRTRDENIARWVDNVPHEEGRAHSHDHLSGHSR